MLSNYTCSNPNLRNTSNPRFYSYQNWYPPFFLSRKTYKSRWESLIELYVLILYTKYENECFITLIYSNTKNANKGARAIVRHHHHEIYKHVKQTFVALFNLRVDKDQTSFCEFVSCRIAVGQTTTAHWSTRTSITQ